MLTAGGENVIEGLSIGVEGIVAKPIDDFNLKFIYFGTF